ncbi:prophage antirepressor-like protein [Desulfosalsimonas propionicica]|uniref:Prophage antirepressor-like protein n=1 Tax=Desulfosalsimonas propionicica TaxID=332175 RepID=A0A7W0HM90_9BACT|nr:Bro-N domain-containing protein [Desulfosalsimonas propionicica]MBA2883159.1 prophage antirepressor-like protein [Desulfosalsimonas propionicica]
MNLIPFEYRSKQIRVVQDDGGDPWWIAKDVCEVLDIYDTPQAVARLDYDEKLIRTLHVSGQNRELWTISEAGLYSLILRSNKPEAKNFKRWITHEVLPTIRSTGKYEIDTSSEIDLIIRSAQALKNIETKQIEHDQRLSLLEAKSHENSGYTGYWTITAWCKLNNYKIGIEEATRKGRKATRLSSEWSVDICRVPDERFGVVNSYREDVLEEIFDTFSVNA